jgi:phosphate uptake regulator
LQRENDVKQIRKLQLSGGSTYIISLPKNWIDELKLKVADNITLVKNLNKSLTLYSEKEQRDTKHAILFLGQNDSEESIRRKIIATYLAGYNMIDIKTKGVRIQPEHSRVVRNLVRTSMIGTEILDSTSEGITIQVLTRFADLTFDTAMKRIQIMAANMHKEAIMALANSDQDHAEETIRMDDEVDRFSLYMRRNLLIGIENADVLLELGLKKPSDCLGHREVISRIERIADHAVLIAKRVKFLEEGVDQKTMKKISSLSENAIKIFEDAMNALTTKDYALAENVAAEVKNLVEKQKQLMAEADKMSKNSSVVRFVLEDIRRTAEYSNDISEVAIDENIQKIIQK